MRAVIADVLGSIRRHVLRLVASHRARRVVLRSAMPVGPVTGAVWSLIDLNLNSSILYDHDRLSGAPEAFEPRPTLPTRLEHAVPLVPNVGWLNA